jgi:hypothetical protein
MHRSLPFGFITPFEGSVTKVNLYAEHFKKRLPNGGDLLALRDRVGRNKGGAYLRTL